jgi:hypothetical protein
MRVVTSLALVWQLLAVIFVPVALCCTDGRASDATSHAQTPITDCPMHHVQQTPDAEPSCPLHAAKRSHECDCPTLGCSQTDKGFMALFGPIGVLPAPSAIAAPTPAESAFATRTASPNHLSPLPLSPPPRT